MGFYLPRKKKIKKQGSQTETITLSSDNTAKVHTNLEKSGTDTTHHLELEQGVAKLSLKIEDSREFEKKVRVNCYLVGGKLRKCHYPSMGGSQATKVSTNTLEWVWKYLTQTYIYTHLILFGRARHYCGFFF